MPAQNRWAALREVRTPWVSSRWSADSAWVPLARSSPRFAGPWMTHLSTSSASDAGMLPGWPLAFFGRSASNPSAR